MQGCINCYFYLLFSPIMMVGIFFKIMIDVGIFLIKFIYGAIVWIGAILTSLFSNNNHIYNEHSIKTNGSNKNKKRTNQKSKDVSYEEIKFNKEADLWGLSEEDRKIAKEERMSPADFIEAEERDDDELVTDEWEN